LQKAKAKGSAPKFVHRDLGAANRQKVKNPHPEKPQGAAPKEEDARDGPRALRAEKSKPAP